jgi:hypothetical protein
LKSSYVCRKSSVINAGIDKELFTITFFLEGLTAMWTLKGKLLKVNFIGEEGRTTNLAFKLAPTTGIIIDILIGGIADRA